MSRLDRLLTFHQIVVAKSFTGAAKALGVTTTAVSHQVAKLEEELQVTLLRRTTRRVHLTEAGEVFYAQCQRIVEEVEQAERLMEGLKEAPSGTLRVVASRYFSEVYLLPHLKEFLALYPRIRLDLELAERMPDLVSERIDILFGVSLRGEGSWMAKKIATTRYVLCAAPDYFAQHGRPKRPEELREHAYITHKMRRPDDVILLKDEREVPVKPSLRLNDSHAMLQCARDGLGLVMLHHFSVQAALADGTLQECLPGLLPGGIPVYLYYQAGRYEAPKVRCFIDFFAAKIP